ncbi:MAG: hypothetical protein GY787_27625, partial [Alteromonadales bacterium]|nr:hypothetical protein [Alteromonadales bacterium]
GINSVDTTKGADRVFTTKLNLPIVNTDKAEVLSSTEVNLKSIVSANKVNTAISFEWGATDQYGNSVVAVPNEVSGLTPTAATYNLTGLDPNSTYHYKAIGVSTVGTTEGVDTSFTTTAIVATIVADSANAITADAATLYGTVNANNANTSVIFNYGVDNVDDQNINADQTLIVGLRDSLVTTSVTGLLPNTIYKYQVVGNNFVGNAYSVEENFTTAKLPPSTSTTFITNLTSSSATLQGLVNSNNLSTTTSFEYGTDNSYGTTELSDAGVYASYNDSLVQKTISGLDPNTTYHYRAIGANDEGTTYGVDTSFTTDAIPPTVSTGVVSDIQPIQVTLNGVVNANNDNSVVTFVYGLTSAYGDTIVADQSPAIGLLSTNVSVVADSLLPNREYHFKVLAENSVGVTSGLDDTFTTAMMAPTVSTDTISDLSYFDVLVKGVVNSSNLITDVLFEYGETSAYGNYVIADQTSFTGSLDVEVNKTLIDLLPNTTYHYRVLGINSVDTTKGADRVFTTKLNLPIVNTDKAEVLSSTEVNLKSIVSAN